MEPELNLCLYGSLYTEGNQLLDWDKQETFSIFLITRVSYLKKTVVGFTSGLAVLVESEVSNNLRAKMFIP